MHQPLLNRTPTPPASDIYHTSFVDIRRTTCSHRNSPRHSPVHPEHALPTRLRQLRLALRVENSRSTTRLNGSPLRLGVTRRPTDQECPAIAPTFPGAIGPWESHTSQKPSESRAPWVAEPRAARRAAAWRSESSPKLSRLAGDSAARPGLRLRCMARLAGQGRHPSHQRSTVRTPGFTPKRRGVPKRQQPTLSVTHIGRQGAIVKSCG